MDAHPVIRPVFLSASEPNPQRSDEYWDSRKLLNVREAVRAFCAHVLAYYPVVFGGHPAITPLVRQVAERLRHEAQADALRQGSQLKQPRVVMFQSSLYVDRPDSDSEVVTEAHEANGEPAKPVGGRRNASLLRMRYEMLGLPGAGPIHPLLKTYSAQFGSKRKALLGTHEFAAAVFIGGMEGVEREFHIFRDFHPGTPVYPIASTGHACEKLFGQVEGHLTEDIRKALPEETAYNLLLQLLFPVSPGREPAAASMHWRAEPRDNPGDFEKHMDPKRIDGPRPRPPAASTPAA